MRSGHETDEIIRRLNRQERVSNLEGKTDETKETSVAGVFACGDVARAAGNISFAIADGAMAGIGAHRSLIFEKR